jgi:pentatricopeptide repeat protein
MNPVIGQTSEESMIDLANECFEMMEDEGLDIDS